MKQEKRLTEEKEILEKELKIADSLIVEENLNETIGAVAVEERKIQW